MKHLFNLFGLLIFLGSTAQQFETVDSYVRTVEINDSLALDEAVELIIEPFESDLEKTRAIFYWIATNIEYDYETYYNPNRNRFLTEREIIQEAYVFRKGVCSGYAYLFKQMLEYVDIESEVISGYARGDLRTFFNDEVNHAWNKVRIDQNWYLMDVTWARDTVNKKVDNYYFMSDPDSFILSHYPANYEASLLQKNYELEDFLNFPVFTNLYREINCSDIYPTKGRYFAQDNKVTIDFQCSKNYSLLVELSNLENPGWAKIARTQLTINDKNFILNLTQKGEFLLKLGVVEFDENSFDILDPIAYYRIINN